MCPSPPRTPSPWTRRRAPRGIPEMGEKTLRWPGHVDAIQPLLREGRLIEEFERKCVSTEARDVVALVVRIKGAGYTRTATLVCRANGSGAMSAMARTTA